MKGPPTEVCTCCNREVPSYRIDGIYGVCAPCAFEASLDHYPCDHGAKEEEQRMRPASPNREET